MKKPKEVKAWAAINKNGALVWDETTDFPVMCKTKRDVIACLDDVYWPGERVVRVTVRIEE